VLEDNYPPLGGAARATLKHLDLGNRCEMVAVDATAMHKALARRVRRYVVYMRPDLVLLVDEIHAREKSRARCMFHYLDGAETGSDSFTITSGGARLIGTSLYPSVEHNIILGRDERHIAYHTERGLLERTNNYVYTSNLHRSKDLVFVTGMQFGPKPLRTVRWAIEGDPQGGKPFVVKVRNRNVRMDLQAGTVEKRVRLQKG
jgi:hypothetical protein